MPARFYVHFGERGIEGDLARFDEMSNNRPVDL
jgi:hypothetical protein